MSAAYPDGHVDRQFPPLLRLAKQLHAKVQKKVSPNAPTVLVFVGAGPSKAAGLPVARELRDLLHETFVAPDPPSAQIHELLRAELEAHGMRSVSSASLFELVAILSRFEYGQAVIRRAIAEHLGRPSHRPLCYELLAHLAKHRYVDHFLVLNFDRLLDEVLEDELPDRVRVVASAQDIPRPDPHGAPDCFAVHPFGILGEGPYSLTLADVARYGSEPVRTFVEDRLLGSNHYLQPLLLLLVGYRAEDPAFERFLQAHQDRWERLHQEPRHVDLFVVDPDAAAGDVFARFLERGLVSSSHHVALGADDAFELLVDLLEQDWRDGGKPVWIPAARHRIVSRLFTHEQLRRRGRARFEIELVLQGLKSRGFVHPEAFAQIPRIRNYANHEAADVIRALLERKVLTRDTWLPPSGGEETEVFRRQHYVPNYMIESRDRAIQVLADASGERGVTEIEEWRVAGEGAAAHPVLRRVPLDEFLRREIAAIQQAPEIEIVRDSAPEVPWVLGGEAKPILSVDDLSEKTREMLGGALRRGTDGAVKVYGIWSTGEWLFHEGGWAHELGRALLGDPEVELHVIITRAGGVAGDRSVRRETVRERLLGAARAKVTLRWLDWWELNRILTLVQDRHGSFQAVYMRRRLGHPLVSPYFVDAHADRAVRYLRELFDVYWRRAVPVSP